MNEKILKHYICSVPFTYIEVHKNGIFSCCPSWLPNKIGDLENIESVWESDELKKIQQSLIDGSYKYCSKTECPYLSQLILKQSPSNVFINKKHFNKSLISEGPTNINFAFDRSCNLSCPSCRNVAIMANGEELEFIDKTINRIQLKYGKHLKMLYLSGSADPFASKSIRKFLLNFDREKFPNLKHIHLHTNGLLLNEDMWMKLSHIHDLIKTIEISIDAATKETYEIVRRGGNWETILENLKFISTIKLNDKRVSFVVQDTNYIEMEDFYNLMMSIFDNNVDVFFNKITNWGTYSDADFKIKQIWNNTHPEFSFFLHQLNKIKFKKRCIHNMDDIITNNSPTKKVNLI
jgi:MoaA/NifB/PqqE/SkfB family radical SAM enzyme